MSVDQLTRSFEVEPLPNNVCVAHLDHAPLEGLDLLNVLEAAAPVKSPGSLDRIVDQYGNNGVFEGMNNRILRAHKRAFPGAYQRAYVSAQMIRACLEPHTYSPSMNGTSMEFPYDWGSMITTEPANEAELLEIIARVDPYSGVSPQEHLETRVLGRKWGDVYAHEWVQLRDSMIDGPLMYCVPGTRRDWGWKRDHKPPDMAPKLIWRELDGRRVPIANTDASVRTVSQPTHLTYQDGTIGLIIGAMQLGVHNEWPTEHAFKSDELAPEDVRKGTIEMEAAQVPLLAQVSADRILNHPDFEELLAA